MEEDGHRVRGLIWEGLSTAADLGDRWGMAEQLDGTPAGLAATGTWRKAAVIAGAGDATWESMAAAPHPVDRWSRDHWLLPALESAGEAGAGALAEGRALALEDAVAGALEEA